MIADDKMRGIERNIERKNSRIVVDKTDTLENNLAANYIAEYDYTDYVEDNFCLDLMEKIESDSESKYKFEKKDDIWELLNKFYTYLPLDQISITLQDITDLFSLLGYKKIIILDNGCRKSGAIENQSTNIQKYKDSSHFSKKFGGIRKCKKNKSKKCKKCKKNKSRKCKRSKKLLKRSKTGKKIKNSRKKNKK
jgi:hypothetical protein